MNEKQQIDVIITLDIAKGMSVKEFIEIFSQELISARPITFEALDKELNLKDRKFYIRSKDLPEFRPLSDIVDKPAKLEIGC